jgi:hypothetical protein
VNDLVGAWLEVGGSQPDVHPLSRPAAESPVRAVSPVLSGDGLLDLAWVHQPVDAGSSFPSSAVVERRGAVDCACLAGSP